MFFDYEINMCAIFAIRQFDIAESTFTVTIVDQYIIQFHICHQKSEIMWRCAVIMTFHVLIWTILFLCKAARACKTVFVTCFTFEDWSLFVVDSINRSLSRCFKTSKEESWISSIRRRRDDMIWKCLRMSRSLRKRKSDAVFKMTFCFVCVSLWQVRRREAKWCDRWKFLHSSSYVLMQSLRDQIIVMSVICLTINLHE